MIKTNGLRQSAKQIEKLKKLEEEQRLTDEKFMRLAIEQAEIAKFLGEVPVGAVIVKDGEVIASACNRKETDDCALSHAEINAIAEASKRLGWRLDGCDIYVTLEPCAMCAGAIISARIRRVVFGASEPKSGFFGSAADLSKTSGLNHSAEIVGGVCAEACQKIIADFFGGRR